MQLTRYGYHNTHSEAGRPNKAVFDSESVNSAYVWVNYYGNPTYMLYFDDGSTLMLVGDYGAMNGLNHISARSVQRKKDL